MLGSNIPPASASPVAALPSSSITTSSAYNQTYGDKGKDEESICQAAYDFPSDFSHSTNPHIDAISLLNNGTLSKSFLTCNSPKTLKSGLECVQCVEVFPDFVQSMNHCVPEWDDATGKEMDIIWEQTDLFSPSKGKWDSGHTTRKSDFGFVPELDFEELCWEDGQLLVVMQGLNGKGTTKNRSAWQLNTGETTSASMLPTTGAFDTPRSAELVDPSSVNIHAQEDELLSWLQHPPEDLVDRLEMPSDMPTLSTPLTSGGRVYPSDPTHRGFRWNLELLNDIDNGPVSKFAKTDTLATFSPSKTGHGSINQQIEFSGGSGLVSNVTMRNKEPCEPCRSLPSGVEIPPPPQMHSAPLSMPCGTSVPNASTSAMNFSNFSRPAVAFKANLHSLGIANGLSGVERLKQLDRVAADVFKSQSIDPVTQRLKLISPRREGAALPAVSSLSQSVGASLIRDPGHSFSRHKEAKQNAFADCDGRLPGQNSSLQKEDNQDFSATGALKRSSGMGIESDGWNSSFISSTTLWMDGSNRVLEVPEPSELLSSGGSEDSDGVDGKRAAGMVKRKLYDEDSEVQSEALENEATGSKKQTMASENSMKKSKAAENHNQSERRRRDRISEKMKALQALVPNSHKTDKASMLEEAIAYIKALKSQIQMMSSRGGMFFSPMLLPHGVQHAQMASWPPMNMGIGMNMGMGMSAGMGMFDMNMVMATAAPRPFSPMMTFPSAIIQGVQATDSVAVGTAQVSRGVAGHVVPLPAHQMIPIRPGVSFAGTSDFSPVINGAPPQSCQTSQLGQPVQIAPMGAKGNKIPYSHQRLQPTNFQSGSG